MRNVPYVLLLLGELGSAFATGVLETIQERADIASVIEYSPLLARTNECPAQIRTRVLASQRNKVEQERLQDPVIDVVGGAPQELSGVGRCPAVKSVTEALPGAPRSRSPRRRSSS